MSREKNLSVLIYDQLCTFEFGVAYEVFGLPRPEVGPNWYRFRTCAIEDGPISSAGGLTLSVNAGLDQLDDAHTIIVPGWRSIDSPVPEDVIMSLQRQKERGARFISLCSGVTVLAEAGLLDGRKATSHWRYLPALKARFPKIEFVEDTLYVDEGSILTAAGSAAGIDLCMHVVRCDYGSDAATKVSQRLVMPPYREGGQTQFLPRPVGLRHERNRLGKSLDWAQSNLDMTISITELAERAGMSRRTLHRRMAETFGLTPLAWLRRERIRFSQSLLESNTSMSVDDVASACGFGSPDSFRRHFKREIGVAPTVYRYRFQQL